jgi:uncharacterized protein YcbX
MSEDASTADRRAAPDEADPHLAHLQIFPIKALDRETPEETVVGPAGALAGDRRWAIVDAPADEPHDPSRASARGDYVNGKATDAVHRLRSTFHTEGSPAPLDADEADVTFRATDESSTPNRVDGERQQFRLDRDGDDNRAAANRWLSAYFDRPVSLRHAAEPGMPDRRHLGGPTVISTATLREVASWFDISLASARRRFRANVEIGGVPAFWEDQLYAEDGDVVRFRISDAVLEGVSPCGRCVTPTRDPDTGEVTPEFRERFIRRRRETVSPWTEGERFEHYFTLAVTTRAPEGAGTDDTRIAIGDDVEILGTVGE